MAVRICHIKLNGSMDETVPVGLGLERNKIGCYSAVNGAFCADCSELIPHQFPVTS